MFYELDWGHVLRDLRCFDTNQIRNDHIDLILLNRKEHSDILFGEIQY